MLFNSYSFLIFFALVLTAHWVLPHWGFRKGVLLVASYAFYAAWNPPFILLLAGSTVADWFLAKALDRAERPGRRKALLAVSLAVNLGALGFFKYGTFFLENLAIFSRWAGQVYVPPELDIVLPVGISFYTFQTLSYTIDVYRCRMKPWHSFLDYALYVSFFPQLVAGPIVRARDFLPQTRSAPAFDANRLAWGLGLLLLGLFQKVVMADAIFAPVADAVYSHPHDVGTAEAWMGTLAFSGQIFSDFAGYSTCAIGCALALGFHLPTNFAFPYAAVGLSDFWRRWHISLSTWLRDYLYIPLGGSRLGPTRTYRNLFITMLLGGLWHGAAWTFVIWGALHGTYLAVERRFRDDIARAGKAGKVVLGSLTFGLVCLAWVFFRATNLSHALAILASMFGVGPPAAAPLDKQAALWAMAGMAGLLATHLWMRHRALEEEVARAPRWVIATAMGVMLLALLLFPGQDRAFIYFQF